MRDQYVKRYSPLAQTLHWVVVALIVGQWALAEVAADVESKVLALALLALHKSFGMTVLMLAVVRLVYRFSSVQPALPSAMPSWQKKAADCLHAALYLLIFLLPLSGWLGSSAASYSVSWFNVFVFPNLVAADDSLKTFFFVVHEWSWRTLCAIALIHILAAFKHQFVDKDSILSKMSSKISLSMGVFVLLVVLGLLFWQSNKSLIAKDVATNNSSAGNLSADNVVLQDQAETNDAMDTTDIWMIDYSKSSIVFEAEQAGAKFTGKFNVWETQIAINLNNPNVGRIETEIELASVSTQDAERDKTLASQEFFSTALFPISKFRAKDFSYDESNRNFIARASLTIKGKTYPIDFNFSLEEDGGIKTLTGSARLDRLQLMVGVGEWLDTSWVGQYVDVKVVVKSLP